MKRIAVGLTWAFLLMWAGNYVALYAGIPAIVTASVAVAIGIVIATDPLGLIWPKPLPRPVRPATSSGATTEHLSRA